jgi:hypothetical protein
VPARFVGAPFYVLQNHVARPLLTSILLGFT